jgi:pilus assembly protein CpaE
VIDLGLARPRDGAGCAREADHVWAVCDQSVGGIVSLTEMLSTLQAGGGADAMAVINRARCAVPAWRPRTLPGGCTPLRHVLPQRDLAMLQASSQGQLLSEADAADPYCVQVRQMAAALQADGVPPRPGRRGCCSCQTWLQRAGGRTP